MRHKRLNTSTALLAREAIVAPVERARKKNTPWVVDENDLHIKIDDMLTERDVDLIEWLVKHGEPTRIRGGEVAFKFSLYAAANALGQSRGRIIERIRRRQKTLIDVRQGDWVCTAQMFGPSLRNMREGVYMIAFTRQFAELWNHGLRLHYADLVDDILPIASPVVRRLVRRTINHETRKLEGETRKESIKHFLEKIRLGADATEESKKEMWRIASNDIKAAADYLEAIFGIEIVTLKDGQLGLKYKRDDSDKRIWCENGACVPLPSDDRTAEAA